MDNLKIAVAQFQPKDGDKEYNLSVIEKLTAKAKACTLSLTSEALIACVAFLPYASKNF